MPVIKVDMFEGRSREQKAALVEKITEAFVEIANASPDHVWVVFEDFAKENWAIAGKLQDEV